jgi:hypothetical protein
MSYAGSGQDEMKGEGKNSVAQLVVGGMTVAVEQDSKEARSHDHPSRPRHRLLLLLSPVNDGKHDRVQETAYVTIEQHIISSRFVSHASDHLGSRTEDTHREHDTCHIVEPLVVPGTVACLPGEPVEATADAAPLSPLVDAH